jgi:small-conductance mechanosensitive channel
MTFDHIWNSLSEAAPGIVAAVPVAAAVILGGILLNIIIKRSLLLLAKRTQLTAQDIVPARKVLGWLVRIVTAVVVLGVFGFQLGGLWAMISTVLAMIAIGFVAVWSLLSHTSATLILVILRPFSIGDDIELPSENAKGRVIDLNFFFTTLLTHDGAEWRIPNNLFFQKVMKRETGKSTISLSNQLQSSEPANISPPPAPVTTPATVPAPAPSNPPAAPVHSTTN